MRVLRGAEEDIDGHKYRVQFKKKKIVKKRSKNSKGREIQQKFLILHFDMKPPNHKQITTEKSLLISEDFKYITCETEADKYIAGKVKVTTTVV